MSQTSFVFTFVFAFFILSGCTDNPKDDIHALLEARSQSISEQNIEQYHTLLDDKYLQSEGVGKITQMESIFQRFEKVQMHVRDQEIRILNDYQAICEQTYILKVFADGEWREIVQREQLTFTKNGDTWKISGGL